MKKECVDIDIVRYQVGGIWLISFYVAYLINNFVDNVWFALIMVGAWLAPGFYIFIKGVRGLED